MPAPPALAEPIALAEPAALAGPARRRTAAPGWTPRDLHQRFGPIPLGRVLTDPAPGTATVADWEAANRRGDGLYELIDGTLIRKAGSDLSSWLGGWFVTLLNDHVTPARLGWVHPSDGFFHLPDGLRAPDASFTRRASRPDGRLQERGYSRVPPALVVEALSPGNTRAEMERKRSVYFAAGVELVWEADPLARTVVVWSGPDADTTLREGDTLTGGGVLPGFSVPLDDLFAGADLSDAN